MKVIEKSGMIYIPEWNKNKKDPNPIKVYWRYLTGPERDRITGFEPIEFDAESGKQIGKLRFRIDNPALITASINKIENLEIEIDGEIRAVKKDDLLKLTILSGLYKELADFFMTENRPVDKKKLK